MRSEVSDSHVPGILLLLSHGYVPTIAFSMVHNDQKVGLHMFAVCVSVLQGNVHTHLCAFRFSCARDWMVVLSCLCTHVRDSLRLCFSVSVPGREHKGVTRFFPGLAEPFESVRMWMR